MEASYIKTMSKIADVLGLKRCRRLTLKLEVGTPITVEAEIYPEVDGVMQLEPILKQFTLVEKKDEQDPE